MMPDASMDRLRDARKIAYASARQAGVWLTPDDWLDAVDCAWWYRELPGRDREAIIALVWGSL